MQLFKLDSAFLKSKIARRIFFLFVGCALLPLAVLTGLTFFHVTRQIEIQSLARLQQSSKVHGMSIYERLLSMESDMQFVATTLRQNPNGESPLAGFDGLFQERIGQRYRALFLYENGAGPRPLFGEPAAAFVPSRDFLPGGDKNQLLIKKEKNGPAEVFLLVPVDRGAPRGPVLVARINTTYLWGIGHENILPPMTELCIIDQKRDVLVSSFPADSRLLREIAFRSGGADARQFEYTEAGAGDFLVSFWPLYLKGRFSSQNLTVILRQARAEVLSPLEDFKIIFPLVVLLSLWIVLLLSMVFIRRYMVPVEKLQEATVHIARRDFSLEVDVRSGDEFETLARSFNRMSSQLNKQFKALETISDISQSILSSLHSKQIVATGLSRLCQFLQSEASQLLLFKDPKSHLAEVATYSVEASINSEEERIEISPAEKRQLLENRYLIRTGQEHLPRYLTAFFREPMPVCLQLPLVGNRELKGVISLGFKTERALSDEDCNQARQLADQLTIALENAGLIETLEKFNWGTLQALARTVDAKSPWTAGHSERVTDLVLRTARIMGCPEREIATLHQASLVHDIGKIAVPHSILDKPGKLSEEEFALIKEHPYVGARILEPISAFADAIDIVLHHHERCDGSGYPHGLRGEAICLGARILAVADVYDALISERPYRDGWVKDRVLEHIQAESGSRFDPAVIKAFLLAVQ
ncbi:HD domain-containing phosphohydrolase [Thiovibrio sp. JS02]